MSKMKPRQNKEDDVEAPLPTDFDWHAGKAISYHELAWSTKSQNHNRTHEAPGHRNFIRPPPKKGQRISGPDSTPCSFEPDSKDFGIYMETDSGLRSLEKLNAYNPPKRTQIIRISNSALKKTYYIKADPDLQRELERDNPAWFSESFELGLGPIDPKLSEEVERSLREALIELPEGGRIEVELPDSAAEDEENERRRKNETSCVPGKNQICAKCTQIVKESEVLNRPWKKILDDKNKGLVRKQVEEHIEFTGKKVNLFKHHGRLGLLRRSAQSGCHLCSLLDSFDPREPFTYDENSQIPYEVKVIYAANHSNGPGVLVLAPRGTRSKASYLMYGASKPVIGETLKEKRTDADAVIELGKKWLNECVTTHESCRNHTLKPTDFIPTRLIRVETRNKTLYSVTLVFGKELPPNTKYLTLSHCWGGADIIKLTNATIDDFEIDIPKQRLPQNFTDALLVTGALGYEYIWIDSLCIIQDSSEDWAHEAALMGSVYRHSVCTIAAVGAANSFGGCFTNRSALSFTPCQLKSPSESEPGVYCENWQQQPQPLHTRAWVVQERCLSIRTLNFGAEMLFWDCICGKASEDRPNMEATEHDASLKRHFYALLDSPHNSGQVSKYWRNNWWQLVSTYTSCNITFIKDKWPAMQGLATAVEKNRNQVLVQGLWKHKLSDELLWTIDYPAEARVGDQIGAPSWTWLSVQGKVRKRWFNPEHIVVDATITLPSNGDTTQLRFIARMLPLSWVLSANPPRDRTPTHPFRLRDGVRPPRPENTVPQWDGRWIPDTQPDEQWETWALQLVRSTDEEELKERGGLVVVPVKGEEGKKVWKRVGFYNFQYRDEANVYSRAAARRWFGYWTEGILV